MKKHFVCQECGAVYPKWSGKCEACGIWNRIEEEGCGKKSNIFTTLEDVESSQKNRIKSNVEEFDRVCGGGLVPGSVILVGGSPGIGKSTLMLQIVSELSKTTKCGYIAGEEGLSQIKMRAERLDVKTDNFKITTSINVSDFIDAIEKDNKLKVVVVDSIQTLQHPSIDGASGSVSQIKFVTQALINSAKKNHYVILLIGHVTKDGAIAGPRILEHMVDVVLYFDGETHYDYRILRSVKNRFGPTNEIGVFSMTSKGLAEVSNPSSLFLSDSYSENVSGTSIVSSLEGTRPILCEVQALVAQTFLPSARRTSVGFDSSRLSMLVAVLQSRCDINLSNKDVYLNVAGGFKLCEPAADLAVVASLKSAFDNQANPTEAVYFGEVCLSGQIRPSPHFDRRINEIIKLGFKSVYCNLGSNEAPKDIKIHDVKHVRDLL